MNNRFSREKAAINSYLCGDGDISAREKRFCYDIRFYLDDVGLAKRVKRLFEKEFNISPAIRKMESKVLGGERYYKVEISNKPVCLHLLNLGTYGSLTWSVPPELNRTLQVEWVKCFFDCEAHVNLKNKQIQLKSVNGRGLKRLKNILECLRIYSKLYGSYNQKGKNHNPYYFLIILGKNNIFTYHKKVGFYHTKKIKQLEELIKLLNL